MSNGAWFGLGFLAAYFAASLALLGRIAWITLTAWRSIFRPQPKLCDECGHAAHRGECERERGDQEVDGCLVAMGPCGCKGERR